MLCWCDTAVLCVHSSTRRTFSEIWRILFVAFVMFQRWCDIRHWWGQRLAGLYASANSTQENKEERGRWDDRSAAYFEGPQTRLMREQCEMAVDLTDEHCQAGRVRWNITVPICPKRHSHTEKSSLIHHYWRESQLCNRQVPEVEKISDVSGNSGESGLKKPLAEWLRL